MHLKADPRVKQFQASVVDEAYLLLQNEGIEGFSMRKLAKSIGWSTQKLYSTFKNKDEILLAVATHLRERIRQRNLTVKQEADPLRYFLDLTFSALQFYVDEPVALEVLMAQRYRLDAPITDDANEPYFQALKGMNCPALKESAAFDDALNSIRILLIGASYCLRGASAPQRQQVFRRTEFALYSMLRSWGCSD